MKRRTQKIFITLLALFIAGFAMVNAYTFEVLNWNPFWVLNLRTLIMKPDVNTTWIIIDWASYTIKVNPNHEEMWVWQIRVSQICDESWANCKEISNIVDVEWGKWLNNIEIIPWEEGQYCYATDTGTIICTGKFNYWTITWDADYVCVSQWDWNAICNKVKLWQMENGSICVYNSERKAIECTTSNPTGVAWTPGNWVDATWTNNGRCKYQCEGWTITITWNCDSLAWDDKITCNKLAAEYHNEQWCLDITNNIGCQNIAYTIQNSHPSWITVNGEWCSIVCDQPEPTCSGQCLGWDWNTVTYNWIQVTQYSGGKYCKYMTPAALDQLGRMAEGAWSRREWLTIEWSWEIRCMFNEGTSSSSSSTQTIQIKWDPDKICVKIDDNSINCNIDPSELQGGGWGGDASSWLWKWTDSLVYPVKTTTKVAIWTTVSNDYTLNVAWSWKFSTNLNVWNYLYIRGYENRKVYVPWHCTERYIPSPMINYYDELVIRQRTWLSCANDYTMFGANWNVWIGWESDAWNLKLSVYWHTRIYSQASDSDQFIDLYTTDYWQSHIESMWREMRVWLTWVIDWFWNPTYLYFKYWSIWVNKIPDANVPGVANKATLQINGWIQISNNSTISNSSPSTNCWPTQEWMIQYYNWEFYGCNGSAWKKFDMTSLWTQAGGGVGQQ